MILLRQLLFGQAIEHIHLLRQHFGPLEPFREQHDFANLLQIRYNHGHRSEQSFQIIWEFRTTSVTRVHGDEEPADAEPCDAFDFHVPHTNIAGGGVVDQGVLDSSQLGGDDGQHLKEMRGGEGGVIRGVVEKVVRGYVEKGVDTGN